MSKQYFDVLVVIPLEEELLEFQRHFESVENKSIASVFRYAVSGGNPDLKTLVWQQTVMGKSSAARATADALDEFEIGVVISLGIAGGMSKDLHLGDVCYSDGIIDVYDNTSTRDTKNGDIELEFSPTYHRSERDLSQSFNFCRTLPELKGRYQDWQENREKEIWNQIDVPVLGRSGQREMIGRPSTLNGLIACGAINRSQRYTKKLLSVDRRILAIDTESGGVFETCLAKGVPSLTIRGISDYADEGKSELESSTRGRVRTVAAANAASFLRLQYANPYFGQYLERRRLSFAGIGRVLPVAAPVSDLSSVLSEIGEQVNNKLRDLSPEFKLMPKGYQLPLPRIRRSEYTTSNLGSRRGADPIEIREALKTGRSIFLNVPRNYPDNSLCWVIADDLLLAEFEGKQVVPVVIDGEALRPPRSGFSHLGGDWINNLAKDPNVQVVFIVDGVPLASKTRMDFLLEQINLFPTSRFVFTARSGRQLIEESAFLSKTSVDEYSVVGISFFEIAHFVQKNFSMSTPEAEVVALRLRDTFNKFRLSAHPTYFAGIPRETLAAILQANRRAELIQLAVDGFLTFLVAEDKADLALGRTARSRFLRRLAVAIRVNKENLDRARLIEFTQSFFQDFDFKLEPMEFVQSFIDKGIIRFDNEYIRFSLPFIESYLLAVELRDDPDSALRYFRIEDPDFDIATFDVYAELGPVPAFVSKIVETLEGCLTQLSTPPRDEHVLLTDQIRPVLLGRQERVTALREALSKASEDVRSNKDETKEKQRILDIVDKIRETTAERVERKSASSSKKRDNETVAAKLQLPIDAWAVGVILLGSGAEHLQAPVKRQLATLLVKLGSVIIDEWTRAYASIDFSSVKSELSDPDLLAKLSPSTKKLSQEETEKLVSGLVDILEVSTLGEPFHRVADWLCEQARSKVLAASVEHVEADGVFEQMLFGAWLADIDNASGKDVLKAAIKALPPAPFLRVSLASHFLARVYWSHWRKEDRLALLDAAEDALRAVNMKFDKPQMKRLIENSEEQGSGDGA